MKDELIRVLESLKYPVFQQGTMNQEEGYPEAYFTFKNMNTISDGFYDNEEHKEIWIFIVAFYSSNPSLVNTELLKAKKNLIENGFIVSGSGNDVDSDEPTQTGRGIIVKKIKIL